MRKMSFEEAKKCQKKICLLAANKGSKVQKQFEMKKKLMGSAEATPEVSRKVTCRTAHANDHKRQKRVVLSLLQNEKRSGPT